MLLASKVNPEFIESISKFYNEFFSGLAQSIDTLAIVQNKFKEEYKGISEFGNNPTAIDGLMSKLTLEEQGVMLKVLLKSSDFSRRTANLFSSTIEEKKQLAKDLRDFTKDLEKQVKLALKA